MFAGLPSLTHEQQQKAVERIQELMAQGMSSGQAIALVAEELRANHSGERIVARLRMKTSNTLIRIAFVIEADGYLIVRKRTLFICD
ncbi:Uncharacterized protein conserved in bacteria [Escherichia coli]|nr:Uncharacterized protein conserved in bacteria [Escherichia coli]